MSSLIEGFLEQLDEADVKVSLSALISAESGSEPTVLTSKASIKGVIALLCLSSQIGCSFALLAGKRDAQGLSLFKDCALRVDIDHAVEAASSAVKESLAVLDKGWVSPSAAWKYPGQFLKREWLLHASEAMRAFMCDLFAAAKAATETLATELKGAVPHYSHIFTPTKLNQKLAVQVLLNAKTMTAVSTKVKSLHKMLLLVGSLGETAQIVMSDDVELEESRGTLRSGHHCLSVMAAAKVLYGMGASPTERAAEASKLLSKDRPELTKAVVEALKKVS